MKGTVQVVIADNLGAHGVAGLESFSGEYYCRFCTGRSLDIQNEVRSGVFPQVAVLKIW